MKPKPTGLMVICIAAISLGVLGVGTGLLSGLQLAVGEKIQQSMMKMNFAAGPNTNPRMQQMQQDQIQLQQEIQAVTQRWKVLNWCLLGGQIGISLSLLTGGIVSLLLKPWGRTTLIVACLLGVVYELVHAVPTYAIQQDTMAITQRYMLKTMTPPPGAGPKMPPGAQNMMKNMMRVGMYFGLAITFGFALLKLGYYVTGAVYLSRSKTKALFSEEELPLPDEPIFDAG